MKNMRVSKKLIIGFLTVIVLSVIIGAVGIYGLNSMSTEAEHMYADMALFICRVVLIFF